MTDASQPELRTLQDQARFARRLAGRWARDGHMAEDLAQEALIVALRMGDSEAHRSRGWWGKLLQNLGRTRRRGESRRTDRERQVARPEGVPCPQGQALPALDRSRLIDAVHRLPGPYREAIRLRYLEGHSARSAAEQLGWNESTLATRTAEGLRRLRLQLGREREPGRVSWFASAFPSLWNRRSTPGLAAPTRSLLMGNSLKLLATLGILAGVALALTRTSPAPLASLEGGQSQPGASTQSGSALPVINARVSAADVEQESAPQLDGMPPGFVHPPIPEVSNRTRTLRGRVVDLSGQGVARVDVLAAHFVGGRARPRWVEGISAKTRTDSRGRFELEGPTRATLWVEHPDLATAYRAHALSEEDGEGILLVVSRRIDLAGHVVDPLGSPIPGATLTLLPPDRPYLPPGRELAMSELMQHSAKSGDQGGFEFEQLPDLGASSLYVMARGHESVTLEIPAGGQHQMRIVLAKASSGPEMLAGFVVHRDGSPAAGAWVSAGRDSALSEADGSFSLPLVHGEHRHKEFEEQTIQVHAVLPGYQPGSAPSPSIEACREVEKREPLRLVLGGPCLTIEGRVVDGEGTPVRGLAVRVRETQTFGLVRSEGLGWSQLQSLEQAMGGGQATTNHEGFFRIEGLRDRAYSLEILQRPSLLRTITDPIPAGTGGHEFLFDVAAAATLVGQLVDRFGVPIEGATISVSQKWPGRLEVGARAATDSQGRFRIEQATPEPVFLRIEGRPVVTNLFYELAEGADIQDLRIEAARRCSIQFEFGDWKGRATALMALDGHGKPVTMIYERSSVIGERPTVRIEEGYSKVHSLSDEATHIVVLDGERELARHPIRLTPGEVFVLRL